MTTEPGAAIDVGRLMEEIKDRVRERRASGFYSEDEVRRVTQMELELEAGDLAPGVEAELERHLAELNDRWDATEAPQITSHRKGVGGLIVAGKRALRAVTKPYIGMVLARQVDFNSTLLHLLNAFVLPLREGVARLTRRMEDLSLETHERLTLAHDQGQRRHRELGERLERLGAELASLRAAVDRTRDPAPTAALPPAPIPPPGAATLPGAAYVRFEDRHRGSREDIRQRQRAYLELFAARPGLPVLPVLDVGCGRGEFLELCREAGIEARGIDVDAGMVARCREAGLAAEQADALAYLDRLPDGALGGIFCAQVIEHLPADALIALVRLAHAKLAPGAVLLCETPNPACLTVFSGAFYVDLTHIKPIHPEAARFVLEAAGFTGVELRLVNPYPPEAKLQPIELLWYMRRYEEAFVTALNDNVARLNELLFGAQDYAVIGRKA